MSFQSAYLKVLRARRHVNRLEKLIHRFIKTHPYEVSSYIDSQTGCKVWFARKVPSPPLGLNVTVGDVLYNLRSALDHAVWQLVIENGQEPKKINAFPICTKDGEWESFAQRRLKGVSDEAKAVIKAFQPHFGGDDSLAWLDALCNADKHRHPNVTIATAFIASWSPPPTHEPFVHVGPIKTNAVLAIFHGDDAHVQFRSSGHVAVTDAELPGSEMLDDILGYLARDHVPKILRALEALYPSSAKPMTNHRRRPEKYE